MQLFQSACLDYMLYMSSRSTNFPLGTVSCFCFKSVISEVILSFRLWRFSIISPINRYLIISHSCSFICIKTISSQMSFSSSSFIFSFISSVISSIIPSIIYSIVSSFILIIISLSFHFSYQISCHLSTGIYPLASCEYSCLHQHPTIAHPKLLNANSLKSIGFLSLKNIANCTKQLCKYCSITIKLKSPSKSLSILTKSIYLIQ